VSRGDKAVWIIKSAGTGERGAACAHAVEMAEPSTAAHGTGSVECKCGDLLRRRSPDDPNGQTEDRQGAFCD
jgi:hypothetical protein